MKHFEAIATCEQNCNFLYYTKMRLEYRAAFRIAFSFKEKAIEPFHDYGLYKISELSCMIFRYHKYFNLKRVILTATPKGDTYLAVR